VLTGLFKEQRDVKHDQRRIGIVGQEGAAHFADFGMDDGLEPGERLRVAEHGGTQLLAVDSLRPGRAGKGALDRFEQRTAGPCSS
jgi:hypothetical protein